MERTLSIIKPDGVKRKLTGKIISRLEEKFEILEMKLKQLTRSEAESFYAEHKGKPFFEHLVDYMTSHKVVLIVLAGKNAIKDYRDLMGATNPQEATQGTLRKEFAISVQENTVHGSDSPASAEREIKHFFEY